MTALKFKKMHGLGNDFVILDARDGMTLPPREVLAAMTDRRTGIGCDQIIPLLPPKMKESQCFMQILNAPDASEAQACGNATRCVADILMQEGGLDKVVIETVAGRLPCSRASEGQITVDMGTPKLNWDEIPLAHECETLYLPSPLIPGPEGREQGTQRQERAIKPTAVNIGNPHAVFFVENVENFPVKELGSRFERDSIFPEKANIEFVQVLSPRELRMRVWERGAGETMACGSGAAASVIAAVRRGLAERQCRVILNGGPLDFDWREEDNHILMTGLSVHVFDGVYEY